MAVGKYKKYSFKARVWKYKGPAGWHFVTLPKTLARKIRKQHGAAEEGWGRLPVTARIGTLSWKTAIWFDSKAKSHLLPIKAAVRKAQKIENKKLVYVTILIRFEESNTSLFT